MSQKLDNLSDSEIEQILGNELKHKSEIAKLNKQIQDLQQGR